MFAALFLITVAGVGLFVVMVGLSRLTLGQCTKAKSAPTCDSSAGGIFAGLLGDAMATHQ